MDLLRPVKFGSCLECEGAKRRKRGPRGLRRVSETAGQSWRKPGTRVKSGRRAGNGKEGCLGGTNALRRTTVRLENLIMEVVMIVDVDSGILFQTDTDQLLGRPSCLLLLTRGLQE